MFPTHSTTTSPQKHHDLRPLFLKTPAKTPIHQRNKESCQNRPVGPVEGPLEEHKPAREKTTLRWARQRPGLLPAFDEWWFE
jgi:hypothetical protein